MIDLRRIVLIIALLSCAVLCFSALAAAPAGKELGLNQIKQSDSSLSTPVTNPQAKAAATSAPVQQENITVLSQDSGNNISNMNITFTASPTYGSAQAVMFTSPKTDWKLQNILIVATDGWNASRKELPSLLPFVIEIRDANLKLLYHFADTQLPYFTTNEGIGMANIEIPDLPLSGDFFVCFYGYGSIVLATELQNATGHSFFFDKPTGQLYSVGGNPALPVNWLIRLAGR